MWAARCTATIWQKTQASTSVSARHPQLVRAVRTRVLVEDVAGVGDLDIANAARSARGTDRRAVKADALPLSQVGATRETAALFVVLGERRAAVVEPEPAVAVGDRGAQAGRERVPPGCTGQKGWPFPFPPSTVATRREPGGGDRASGGERIPRVVQTGPLRHRQRSIRDEHQPPVAVS